MPGSCAVEIKVAMKETDHPFLVADGPGNMPSLTGTFLRANVYEALPLTKVGLQVKPFSRTKNTLCCIVGDLTLLFLFMHLFL